jgi:hypothetical protein
MREHEEQVLNQATKQTNVEPERPVGPQRWWLSWWWVWIPFIVVVILWLGGWGFGDYGGPWSARPQTGEPQITDPVVASLGVRARTPLTSFPFPIDDYRWLPALPG